jgi:glycosyltransferase involved in cell wall biosynthesis
VTRRRVLLIQPSLQPPGGGNAVSAWALQALQQHHDVGVVSWTPLDVGEMNRFYGTSVDPSLLWAETVHGASRWVPDRGPFSLSLLRRALVLRTARRLSSDWDVLLTTSNEADFGRPGIQYIHYPVYRRPRPLDDVRWYHGPAPVINSYYRFADWLADMTPVGIKQNLTLVNSDWTGRLVHVLHGIVPVTLYPPVHATFADVPWAERSDRFLCTGRISPEKQIDRVIDILKLVRKVRPDITLQLVGTFGRDRYSRHIARRVTAERSWISTQTNLSRAALLELIPHHRYGIHGMQEEHFGMAPAEMVSAGCIVFVPNGGGQVEIVGEQPRLIYNDVEEAAESILHVLAHPELQASIRSRLAERKSLFATEHFMAGIRELVETFPQ